MRDDCCIRLGLNFFTKRHATTVIYRLIAKFHYTDPRGPDRTRISEKLRWSVRVSDKVRAGPCGSARVRVVEFSFNCSDFARRSRDSIHSARHDADRTVLSCPAAGVNWALNSVGVHADRVQDRCSRAPAVNDGCIDDRIKPMFS